MFRALWHRLVGHDAVLRVQLDPSSLKAAEDREYRELKAASSIVSVTRTSAEEVQRQAFWRAVDERRTRKARTLRVVGGQR